MTPFECRLRLITADYDPLPVLGKRLAPKAWEKHTKTSAGDIEIWNKVYPTAHNTGCLCRRMPTLDADILNPEAAQAIEDLVRDRYEADRGYVLVRIGLAPSERFRSGPTSHSER